MQKKEYQKPEIKIVKLKHKTKLLEDSGYTGPLAINMSLDNQPKV